RPRRVRAATEWVSRCGTAATIFPGRGRGRHPETAGHAHAHRPYADIRASLGASALPARVKETALAIFRRLAEAEGRVHGVEPDAVEFHEVGALDAIVDVVGAALGFVHLGVEAIYTGPLPLGRGRVETAHGPLPVPAPAAAQRLRGRRGR